MAALFYVRANCRHLAEPCCTNYLKAMRAISLKNVSKSFGKTKAVTNLSIDIPKGEVFCLLGPNGAGKSTTMDLMVGLTKPNSGTINVLGNDPRSDKAKLSMGYVPQDSDFPLNLTWSEIIDLVSAHYKTSHSQEELLTRFGLLDLADRYVGGFSGGQKRRLALALAFAGNNELVYLDEPTTGLDSKARKAFWTYVREYIKRGGTVVVTTHHLEEIEEIATRVCLINRGEKKFDGSVDEIKGRLGQKSLSFECDKLPELSPITEISKTGERFQVISPDADLVVKQLVESESTFRNLEISSVTLEQAIEWFEENDR